jgi:hypothetical protein
MLYEPGESDEKLPDDCHDPPPLMLYSYVPYPPEGDESVIVPSDPPKQVTLVDDIVAESTGGWVSSSEGFSVTSHAVYDASLIFTA